MRVIAGEYRSRLLVAPPGSATRPTSDRLRETLFNVISSRNQVQHCVFADLYAGSGAVGIEAISRGAAHCYFVERAGPALAALQKNLTGLSIAADRATAIRGDTLEFLRTLPRACDVIFLDPPYDDAEAYSHALNLLGRASSGKLNDGALVIAEHAAAKTRKAAAELVDSYGTLHRTLLLEQGDAALSFYSQMD